MSRSLPIERLLAYGYNSNQKIEKLIFTSHHHQSSLSAAMSEEHRKFMHENRVKILGSNLGGYSEYKSVFSSTKTYVEGGDELLQTLVTMPPQQIGVDYFIQTIRKGIEEHNKPDQTIGKGVTDADIERNFQKVHESSPIKTADGSYVFRVFRNKSISDNEEAAHVDAIVDAIRSYQTV